MKGVSFEVAKALKEAGYPQNRTNSHYTYWGELVCYGIAGEKGYDKPTYLEAWLWLWREKKHCIDIVSAHNHDALVHINSELKGFADPEEAIEKAIEYLVENNLIK